MKAVIMAGGKGTRLSEIAKDIPKPMVKIGDKPLLEHQLDNLKRAGINEVIIVVGHYGHIIKGYFKNGNEFGVSISYITEEAPLGTAGSLYYLKDIIKDKFLLIYGDIFINIDFNRMINYHEKMHANLTLFVHPNSHPYDSDLIKINENSRVIGWLYKDEKRPESYSNAVNAGIYVVSCSVLDYVKEIRKMDFEKDIIIPMISKQEQVFAYRSSEYSKDMGTPERYREVIDNYFNGVCESRNLKNKQKCIFIDRDGTVNELNGFIKNPEGMNLISNVPKAIKKVNMSGYLCIIVTNQPVIARGETSIDNLNEIHHKIETLLGVEGSYVDDIYYCPHHPDKGFEGEVSELKINCDCRKPKIGLLEKAAEKYNIDLNQSWMVGDTTRDIQTGKNAGMKTCLVLTGEAGKDMKYDVKADIIANDLLDFINVIID